MFLAWLKHCCNQITANDTAPCEQPKPPCLRCRSLELDHNATLRANRDLREQLTATEEKLVDAIYYRDQYKREIDRARVGVDTSKLTQE